MIKAKLMRTLLTGRCPRVCFAALSVLFTSNFLLPIMLGSSTSDDKQKLFRKMIDSNPTFNQGTLKYKEKPRWEEIRDKLQAKAAAANWKLSPSILDGKLSVPSPEVISDQAPRILLFRNFLSASERATLKRLALESNMTKSGVMDGDSSNQQKVRTSSGAWLDDIGEEAVFNLNRRIQKATQIPW
eukprot:CAMPEP_0177595512 /NCGR_PEP_ID=MMETSP0419_2-20121207/10408_1 /TAXON_ID=582737 /ORGANISM="Tetraselmis sp., Strain GSL018" /LENGTH=185 /DNA_ID=CAMNT_0019087001 /DNA_START=90 /DNA_END=647 /DNA_ORIENTATION=+